MLALALPKVRRPGSGRKSVSPIVALEPGQTCFIRVALSSDMRKTAKQLSSVMSYQRKVYGRRYSLRTHQYDEQGFPGIKVWRIE